MGKSICSILSPVLSNTVTPLRGEIDVALNIDGHAFRTAIVEEAFVCEFAVRSNVVGPSSLPDDVPHVKHLAVRRADDAVGVKEVGRDSA